MRLQIRTTVSVLAAAVMLVSSASKGPALSAGAADTSASAQEQTSSEYRRLADNATKEVVCRRQAVTGTLIPGVVCLTRAQIAEQRESASKVMRDIRENEAMSRPIADRPPGALGSGSPSPP
jgi:hypothetical protein